MEQAGEQRNVSNPEKEVKRSANVWIVPMPWFSHMLCHLNLGRQLAKYGLTVTFCAPDDEIQNLVASNIIRQESWEREGLDIRLQPFKLPALTLGQGSNKTPVNLLSLTTDTEDAFEEALKTSLASPLAPTCVIADYWLTRTREVAAEHNIPALLLATCSPVYIASVFYIHQLKSKGILNLPRYGDPEIQNEVLSLPGLAVCPIKAVPPGCFANSFTAESSQRCALALEKADVVLLSSFKELDGRMFHEFESLLRASATRNHRKVPQLLTIGPTFSLVSHTDGAGEEGSHPVLKFLNSQPQSSVLYVAFGSDGNHSREQILEIAHGLENSQQPFLCVLHPPLKSADCDMDDIFSVIPPECIERSKARGLFVQRWAPQMKVLAHPSTGGFLSHCGYNSLLESVCMGVPLLAWPLFAEQPMNTRWLVSEAQLGLEVRRGPDGFVDRREVERSVRALFHSDEGRAIRRSVLELKEQAKRSVGEDGSTTKHMQALVDRIRGG